MSGDEMRWFAIAFGGALILIGLLAWFASKRWPLAGVVFQFAAAAMAARLAIGGSGVELAGYGAGGAIGFRLIAGAAAVFCLYGGIMQIVTWSRGSGQGAAGDDDNTG